MIHYYGSIIHAGYSIEVRDNGNSGALSVYGSILYAPGIHAHGNSSGLGVYWNSYAYFGDSLVENNTFGGVRAAYGVSIDARDSVSEGNGYYGFDVGANSVGYFNGSSALGNSYDGFLAYDGGILDADDTVSTGNGYHGCGGR